MSESTTPADFYANTLPQRYAAALQGADPSVLDQPELTATIEVTGEGGGTFGLRAQGARLEYVPGGIPAPDMHVTIGIDDWRRSVEGGATEAILDYVERRKVNVAKGLRGTVTLELERSDGTTLTLSTVFGGEAEPAVTLFMTTEDYAAMLRGELNGQMAFMMGKLKFEGSLPLLMQVGNLAG